MNDLIEIRNLSSRHIISPTNTLTVDDPNELLIVNGNLVGLLYPSKSENKNPIKFLRRILNIRLTYISSIKLAILVGKGSILLDNPDIVKAADIIIEEGEHNSFIRRLNHPFEKVLYYSKNAKETVFRNYESNLKLLNFVSSLKTEHKKVYLEDHLVISYNGRRLGKDNFQTEKIRIGDQTRTIFLYNCETSIKSISLSLQSFLTASFFKRFSIDNHKIYSIENNQHNISIFNTNSNLTFETINKLCFAGFSPMNISGRNELIELIYRFQENGKKKY